MVLMKLLKVTIIKERSMHIYIDTHDLLPATTVQLQITRISTFTSTHAHARIRTYTQTHTQRG